jgi:hypothetical protein
MRNGAAKEKRNRFVFFAAYFKLQIWSPRATEYVLFVKGFISFAAEKKIRPLLKESLVNTISTGTITYVHEVYLGLH